MNIELYLINHWSQTRLISINIKTSMGSDTIDFILLAKSSRFPVAASGSGRPFVPESIDFFYAKNVSGPFIAFILLITTYFLSKGINQYSDQRY